MTALSREDVEADLARGDPEDLRDAFDALAGWGPGSRVAGTGSADELMALFRRVAAAMRGSDDATPPDTVRALARRTAVDAGPDLATYGGAARFALAHARSWWADFAASLPEG